MGLIMEYISFKNDTFNESLAILQSGEAEENWNQAEEIFGERQGSIDIDKSSGLLSMLFEDSELGDFILGNDDNRFEFEEVLICIFSNEYMKSVCQFIEKNQLSEKAPFDDYCKGKNEYDEGKADYYFVSLSKFYHFFKASTEKNNWVLGMLM